MSHDVTTGIDRTFYDSSTGDSDRGGLQWGNSQAGYSLSNNLAEAACKASLGGIGIWAWAEVGKEFLVTGDSTEFANVVVDGRYRTARSAFGTASSRVQTSIFLYDKTTDEVVDEFILFDEDAIGLELTTKESFFNQSVSGYLTPGHTYYAGVRARTWATAEFPSTSVADIHRSGNYNGYIKYYNFTIDWI
jgi:hypothetical protein